MSSRVLTLTGVGLAHGPSLHRLLVRMATSGFLLLFDVGPMPLSARGLFLAAASVRPGGGELEMPLHNLLQALSPAGTSGWVHLGTGAAGGQEQPWWDTRDPQPRGPEDIPLAPGALSLCGKDERGCESERVGVSPRVLVGNGEYVSG